MMTLHSISVQNFHDIPQNRSWSFSTSLPPERELFHSISTEYFPRPVPQEVQRVWTTLHLLPIYTCLFEDQPAWSSVPRTQTTMCSFEFHLYYYHIVIIYRSDNGVSRGVSRGFFLCSPQSTFNIEQSNKHWPHVSFWRNWMIEPLDLTHVPPRVSLFPGVQPVEDLGWRPFLMAQTPPALQNHTIRLTEQQT